jgi:hypothetical protein
VNCAGIKDLHVGVPTVIGAKGGMLHTYNAALELCPSLSVEAANLLSPAL